MLRGPFIGIISLEVTKQMRIFWTLHERLPFHHLVWLGQITGYIYYVAWLGKVSQQQKCEKDKGRGGGTVISSLAPLVADPPPRSQRRKGRQMPRRRGNEEIWESMRGELKRQMPFYCSLYVSALQRNHPREARKRNPLVLVFPPALPRSSLPIPASASLMPLEKLTRVMYLYQGSSRYGEEKLLRQGRCFTSEEAVKGR